MLLAIDAGNSTVKFGFFAEDAPAHVFSAGSRPETTADEYLSFLKVHMDRVGLDKDIDGVVISSVVPSVLLTLFETMRSMTDVTPMVVSARLKLGIRIDYKTPDTLGSDRIAAASEAYHARGGPVIVADFGTASTFTAVDASGALLGGMIAPGLLTGYTALMDKTSGIPKTGLSFPGHVIGRSSMEAVQSGVIFGHATMAAGLIAMAAEELGGKASVVVTGGLAHLVLPHIGIEAASEPDLVLLGLHRIHGLNITK